MAKSDTPALPREDWGFDELQAEAEELRSRLNRFRTSLGRFFVQKQELIDLMLVAAVAQEPLLIVGPPGTAKSDLERLLGQPVPAFAYPFGDVDDATVEAVRAARFEYAVNCDAAAVRGGEALLRLPRLEVKRWAEDEFARRLLATRDA